jgi:hypothetical protein
MNIELVKNHFPSLSHRGGYELGSPSEQLEQYLIAKYGNTHRPLKQWGGEFGLISNEETAALLASKVASVATLPFHEMRVKLQEEMGKEDDERAIFYTYSDDPEQQEKLEALKTYENRLRQCVNRSLSLVSRQIDATRKSFKRSQFFGKAEDKSLLIMPDSELMRELKVSIAESHAVPTNFLRGLRIEKNDTGGWGLYAPDATRKGHGCFMAIFDTLVDARFEMKEELQARLTTCREKLTLEQRQGGEYEERWKQSHQCYNIPASVVHFYAINAMTNPIEPHLYDVYESPQYTALRIENHDHNMLGQHGLEIVQTQQVISPRPLPYHLAQEFANAHHDHKTQHNSLQGVSKRLAEAKDKVRELALQVDDAIKAERITRARLTEVKQKIS